MQGGVFHSRTGHCRITIYTSVLTGIICPDINALKAPAGWPLVLVGARADRTARRPFNKRAIDARARQNTICAEIALLGAGIQRDAARLRKFGKSMCKRLLIMF